MDDYTPNIDDLDIDKSLDPQIGLLIAGLDYSTQEWRGELGEPTQEALVWQPFPRGHSIGVILLHMADAEAWWLHQVAAGQTRSEEELKRLLSEETMQDGVDWPTPPDRPLQWYYDQQDEVRARTRELIGKMSDPLQTADINGHGKDWHFTVRRILTHVVAHDSYHGGQAVLLSVIHAKGSEMERSSEQYRIGNTGRGSSRSDD